MSFSDLAGNAALTTRLKHLMSAGKLPRSMIFFGRAGVGKVETALTVAQALNCTVSQNDACGRCPSCIRISKDEHPDVRMLKPEGRGGQLRAEGVREAISEVPFRPFEGRRRVIILADAERMNPTTANTLLKTLEEPPEWATLILTTANEAALLPTILSRCQIFRFSPLAPAELETLLRTRHGIAPERAALLAAVAGGGIARALELAEEPLLELRSQAISLAKLLVESAEAEELVPLADSLSKEPRLMLLLDLLLSILRDLAAKAASA
ncbi:MAG TPA: DNA polymerase III subunit delta', partial [Vicinamibacteria bacterium]|nr:DNA polymerase III subunit delta' [Vicinamibacteria bacterium]